MRSLQCCSFDLLIAIDGKYKEWPNAEDPHFSDKDCLDLIHSFQPQLPVHYIGLTDFTQNEKRQAYFDIAAVRSMDALIVLDSDEYIVCEKTNYALFKKDLESKIKRETYRQAYCIPCQMWDQWPHPNLGGQIQNIPRLYIAPGSLEYAENHFTVRNKRTGVCQVFDGAPICKYIEMGHDHKLRELRYQELSTEYSKWLYSCESGKKIKAENTK